MIHMTDRNGLAVKIEADRTANTIVIEAGGATIEFDYDKTLELITGLALISDLLEDPDETENLS
jgi:hypothetical protein